MQYSTQPKDWSEVVSVQHCSSGMGEARGLDPYPDIRTLIYHTLARHCEELGGTVGDGAALGSPVLQRGGWGWRDWSRDRLMG